MKATSFVCNNRTDRLRTNLLKLKLTSDRPSHHCKKVLESAETVHANKIEESFATEKLGSGDFFRLAYSVLNKIKSVISQMSRGTRFLLSLSDDLKLFAKIFFFFFLN